MAKNYKLGVGHREPKWVSTSLENLGTHPAGYLEPLAGYASVPSGITPIYAIIAPAYGMTINQTTGVLDTTGVTLPDSYTISVSLTMAGARTVSIKTFIIAIEAAAGNAVAAWAADKPSQTWSTANVVGATSVGFSAKYNRSPFRALDQNTGSRNIFNWQGKGMWEPAGNGHQGRVWWMGGGVNLSGGSPGTATMVCYDVATNTFIPYQGTDLATTGLFYPGSEAHGFDAADIDVARRKIYRTMYATPSSNNIQGVGTFDLVSPSDIKPTTTGAAPRDMAALVGNQWTELVAGGFWYVSSSCYVPERNELVALRRAYVAERYSVTNMVKLGEVSFSPYPISGLSMAHNGYVYVSCGASAVYADLGKRLHRIKPDNTQEFVCLNPVQMSCTDGQNAIGGAETNDYAIWVKLGSYLYAFHKNGIIYRLDFNNPFVGWTSYSTISIDLTNGASTDPTAKGRAIHECGFAPVVLNPTTGEGVVLIVGAQDLSQPSRSYLWKP